MCDDGSERRFNQALHYQSEIDGLEEEFQGISERIEREFPAFIGLPLAHQVDLLCKAVLYHAKDPRRG